VNSGKDYGAETGALAQWWSQAEDLYANIDVALQDLGLRAAVATYVTTGKGVNQMITAYLVTLSTSEAQLAVRGHPINAISLRADVCIFAQYRLY
jgi:hypothetical protein